MKRAALSNPTPPTREPFPYADYVKARRSLETALATSCFYALLTGSSGMGKTSLLREITSRLDRHRYHVVYLSSSKASVVGLARFLAQSLHVTPRRSYLETVQVLLEAIHAQSPHLLLWIDEADRIEASTVQEVRMLAESDLVTEQIFSVVLSGLPSLIAQLDAPSLFPLKRRISLRLSLTGLTREELTPFLHHRFGPQDAQRLPAQAADDLFERTQATPALIDSVLREAFAANKGQLDTEDLRSVLDAHGL